MCARYLSRSATALVMSEHALAVSRSFGCSLSSSTSMGNPGDDVKPSSAMTGSLTSAVARLRAERESERESVVSAD